MTFCVSSYKMAALSLLCMAPVIASPMHDALGIVTSAPLASDAISSDSDSFSDEEAVAFPVKDKSAVLSGFIKNPKRYHFSGVSAEKIQIGVHCTGSLPGIKVSQGSEASAEISPSEKKDNFSPNGLGATALYDFKLSTQGEFYIEVVPTTDSTYGEYLLIVGEPPRPKESSSITEKSFTTAAISPENYQGSKESSPILPIMALFALFGLTVLLGYCGCIFIRRSLPPAHTYARRSYAYRYILRYSGPGASGALPFDWDSSGLTIGRSSSCDITFSDPRVSARHCIITAESGRLYLRDLGSSNGTFLNDLPAPPNEKIRLHGGSRISLGDSSVNIEKHHA